MLILKHIYECYNRPPVEVNTVAFPKQVLSWENVKTCISKELHLSAKFKKIIEA